MRKAPPIDLGMKHIRKCTPPNCPHYFNIRFQRRVDGMSVVEVNDKILIKDYDTEDLALKAAKAQRDAHWLELRYGRPKTQRLIDKRNRSGYIGLSFYKTATGISRISARRFEAGPNGEVQRKYKQFTYNPEIKGDKERVEREALQWMGEI
jgi:hypothetical protein